ncbi:Arc family DNA-binding protein [Rhizobium mayense]|uniref:Arc family DNA-binding protein n=1 Tax=Rhizobium mayense TaxID=1312184 RepID=UPI00398C5991
MAKQGRGSEQAMIRLPDGMRDALKAQAEANGRSMNSEIVARLEESLDGRTPSNDALNTIRDLEGRLAIITAISNARLETIEAFIRALAPTEKARDEIWKSIRSGNFQISSSRKEEE